MKMFLIGFKRWREREQRNGVLFENPFPILLPEFSVSELEFQIQFQVLAKPDFPIRILPRLRCHIGKMVYSGQPGIFEPPFFSDILYSIFY